jgi:HK97 family phage major capsid protein
MNNKAKLKALLAEAAELQKKGEDLSEEDLARAEALPGEITELKTAIAKSDQTARALKEALRAEPKDKGDAAASIESKGATVGERFVKSDAMREFRKDNPNGIDGTPVNLKVKGLGSFSRSIKADPAPLSTSLPGAVQRLRLPGIDDLTYRNQPVFLNLITRGTTTADHVEYRQMVSVTNNSKIVPENSVKPLSDMEFRLENANGYTFADGFKVTNQELKDDGIIATLIDTTLKDNLEATIEDKVLNGTGASEPTGIMHMTGTLSQAFSGDAVTTIRKAITALQTRSKAAIQAIVMNPEDIEAIDLLKDTTNRYLGQGPFGIGPRTLWGVPMVAAQNVPAGTALMGDFSVIQLLDYEGLNITAFNQNEDDARKNLTYIRAEQRSLMLCREPAKLLVATIKASA